MSQKIKNPNEKVSCFVVGIIALIAIVAVVIVVVLYMGRNQPIEGLPDEDVSFSFEARLEPRNLRVLRLHGGGRGRFG